jgi:uncharacterized protein
VILIDSNIPIYLIGAEHPNKPIARQIRERLVVRGERLVTDAEVLQEILHRYTAIHRREAIGPAFEAILDVVDEVLPMDRSEVERARWPRDNCALIGSGSGPRRDHAAPRYRAGPELRCRVRQRPGYRPHRSLKGDPAAPRRGTAFEPASAMWHLYASDCAS